MIEIKSFTHTIRIFADYTQLSDLFKVVLYCGYRGDKRTIPFFFSVVKGSSCVTDLRQPISDIMGRMKANTRNEIRRAEKEGCLFSIDDNVRDFIPFYNAFCESKGFPDYVNAKRLAKYNTLLVTRTTHCGAVLAMHVTLLDADSKTALLLLSGSQRLECGIDKKLIGWGNRYLHFKELEWLKANGYATYDWSGVCLDKNDTRYSIGQFKLSFGGEIVDSWSLKSPLYALLEKGRDFIIKYRR